MFKGFLSIIGVSVFFASCFSSKNLVYRDDWEGDFDLRKNDYCCDTVTDVRLKVERDEAEQYHWKLFSRTGQGNDTIYGKAYYVKNKLSFFVENVGVADHFFVRPVNRNDAVFGLQYNIYWSDKE